MTTALDPQTAKRLAFLRMVYEQGVQQSRLPAPLNGTALLSFHDAIELFLVLAADHLRVQVDRKTNFLDYFDRLKKAPNGVHLSCYSSMRRLNDLRNGLKHVGTMPAPDALDQARADTKAFFDDNVPRVFDDLLFDSIDMSDVIPQEDVRAEAKQASKHAADGSRGLAMLSLSYAFSLLMGGRGVMRRFGKPLRQDLRITSSLESTFLRLGDNRTARLGRYLGDVSEAVVEMQDAIRVMAVGLDFDQYRRFWTLLPSIRYYDKEKDQEAVIRDEDRGMVADQEEFEFCRQFLVTAALRVAEAEAHQQRPSWQRGRS